ncbi:unnamed protein product [Amoebophrya sp. A25]|nr:unnamed protein product [Amoebophrya sp. A25]|eukprot:GSA25T00003717001.1
MIKQLAKKQAQTTSEAASLPAKAQAQTTFEAASLSAKAQAQTTSEAAALPAEAKALIDEAAAVLKEVKAKRAEADKVLQETRTETDAALQEAQVKADKADALLRETEAETSAARREAQVKADKADVLLQKTEAETSAALQEAQAKAREFLEEAEKTATKAVADTKAEAAALLEEVSNQAKETAAALEEATAKAAEADALLQGAAIESRGTETALGKANEMVTGAEARLDVAEARFNKMAAALEAETEAALEAKRAGSGGWTGIKKVFGRSLRGSGGKNTQQANIKSPPGSFLQSRTLHGTSNVDKQEEDSQGSSLESGDPRTAFAGASTLVAKIGRHDPMAMLVCSLLLAIILAAFWMFRRKWFCGLRSACTAASNDAGAAGAERGQRSRKQHSSHRCSEYHAVDDIEGGAHEAATTDFGANISGDAGHSSPASASTMFSTNIADYAKNGRKTRIMPDDPPGVNEYHYDYTNRNKMVAPYIVKEKSNKEMSVSFSGKDVVKNIALVCDPHDSYPMHQNPAERDSAFDRCIVNEQGTCSGIMNVPHGKDIMVGAGSTAVGNNDDRNSLANQTGKPKQQRKNMGKHLSTISLTRAHGDEVNSGFATDATGTHQKIDAVDGGDCGNAFSCL